MATKKTANRLEWINDRWHCDGDGIHAGVGMELRGLSARSARVFSCAASCSVAESRLLGYGVGMLQAVAG